MEPADEEHPADAGPTTREGAEQAAALDSLTDMVRGCVDITSSSAP